MGKGRQEWMNTSLLCTKSAWIAKAAPWLASVALATAGVVYGARPAISPAEFCGAPQASHASDTANVTDVTLWAEARMRTCWATYLAAVAAPLVTDHAIRAEVQPLVMDDVPAWNMMRDAAAHGRAPDIMHVDIPTLVEFLRAGYLVPLENCVRTHSEFRNIRADAWATVRMDGHTWGVPMDARADALYFNKVALRRLGWSDARIAALPNMIRDGAWTFDDLRATAREAIQRGIVTPGFGFWPFKGKDGQLYTFYLVQGARAYNPASGKIIINRRALADAFGLRRALLREGVTATFFLGENNQGWTRNVAERDAVLGGRVLFWTAAETEWGNLLAKIPGANAARRLDKRMGVALIPAARPGLAASAAGTFVRMGTAYALTSGAANGGRRRQADACALLAKMSLPAINDLHTSVNGSASVMTAGVPSLTDAQHGYDMHALHDRAWPMPWQAPVTAQMWSHYSGTFWNFTSQSEVDNESNASLAARMVAQLRALLGDQVIVE